MKYKVTLFLLGTAKTEFEITAEDEDQAIDLAEEKVSNMPAEEYNNCSIEDWEFVRDQHEVEEWKGEVEELEEEVNNQ